MSQPPDPDVTATLMAWRRVLLEARRSLRVILPVTIPPGMPADTTLAFGYAMGTVDKTLALVERDLANSAENVASPPRQE